MPPVDGLPTDDAHLRRLIAEAVAELGRGDRDQARWSAVFAGGELERLARDSGGAIGWPKEFADDPLRGWAEYGVELARNGAAQRSKAAPDTRRHEMRPRMGTTHAARSVVED
jgi:hypothetical protein